VGRARHRVRRDPRRRGRASVRRHPVRAPVREPAQPRRAVDRAACVEDRARRWGRPALVRLSEPAHVRQRAVPAVAARALVPDRAHRRRRAVGWCNRRLVAAGAPRIRHAFGRRRYSCNRRGVHGARRVLAGGSHGRSTNARRRGRTRVDGAGPARARGPRRGARYRLQVSGRVPARAARRRRVEAMAAPRRLGRPGSSRIRRVEPVHRRPREAGLARGVPCAAARAGGVARLRARPLGADRFRRSALARPWPGTGRSSSSTSPI
jgi:hypothetical protein